MGRELFGTDGVRGLAGQYPLDDAGCRSIGKAIGSHFAKPGQTILLAQDPRQSSDQIASKVIEGINAVGVNVVRGGVMPTPGLAYLTRENSRFVAGVMITASHNPYQYNGVKAFDANGDKLTDEIEEKLNKLIITEITEVATGSVSTDQSLVRNYEDFLVSSAEDARFDGLSIALDSSNGASSGLSERVITALGAKVESIFDQPDGININAGCGATDTKALQERVKEKGLNAGIAFDGDADRVVLVDEKGRALTGDHLIYVNAVASNLDGVVMTVMTNIGTEQSLLERGVKVERTKVGDRYVLEGLARTGYRLGGEQAGHIIFPELLKTGDGLLAAIQTLKAVSQSGKTLAEWYDEVKLLPQALVNISLDDKAKLESEKVKEFLDQQTDKIGDSGRLLVRPSGTEPLARVMVEAPYADKVAERIAAQLEQLLKEAA